MTLSFVAFPISSFIPRHRIANLKKPPCPFHHHHYHLTTPPHAHAHLIPSSPVPLSIGLNQYSHDAGIAVINLENGDLIFALSKERLTRRKHDGGDVSIVVEHVLRYLSTIWNLPISIIIQDYIKIVVSNNHHFHISSFESNLNSLSLQSSLNYIPNTFLSNFNLFAFSSQNHNQKLEISHHLAHVLSSIIDAPFMSGLVVVMDGMGDSIDYWIRFLNNTNYFTEISSFPNNNIRIRCRDDHNHFIQYPKDVMTTKNGISFREAETAFRFLKYDNDKHQKCIDLIRIFKRWTPENLPSELVNHSFEEMDSIGAVYSRVSAIIFRDWNNCGKVMGLAPYGAIQNNSETSQQQRTFIHGHLHDGSLDTSTSREQGIGLDHVSKFFKDTSSSSNTELLEYFQNIAYAIQFDLESIVLEFIKFLVRLTGERNVVFTGGVAQNSCLNARLFNSDFIDKFHVSPYPGDEGIAIGCAYFGFFHSQTSSSSSTSWKQHVAHMPFLGKFYTSSEIHTAIKSYSPWITIQHFKNSNQVSEFIVDAILKGDIIGWFSENSETGARALGHRSLISRATHVETRDRMNNFVKRRESFRPLAPAALLEYTHEYFSLPQHDDNDDETQYHNCTSVMGMTVSTSQDNKIPGVTHIDGTARIQTVSKSDRGSESFNHIIQCVYNKSGIPVILNTSFNVAGEPIVETPQDAMRAMMNNDGIQMLAFPDVGIVVSRNESAVFCNDIENEHGNVENETWYSACVSFVSTIVEQSGADCCVSVKLNVHRRKHFDDDGDNEEEEEEEEEEVGKEQQVELHDGLELEILETVHNAGIENGCEVSEILESLCVSTDDSLEEAEEGSDNDGPVVADVLKRIESLAMKYLIYKNKKL